MADAPQAQAGGLMKIGTIAAHNIVAAAALPADQVSMVEGAIKDEINAMSSHFTLAMADIQTQYEVELAKIKSDFVWLNANKGKVVVVGSALLSVGALAGIIVGRLV